MLELIKKGSKMATLEKQLCKSKDLIYRRLKEMGFEGLIDARRAIRK